MPSALAVTAPLFDDAALVAQVRAGDAEAESELARRFGPRMRVLCLARNGRPDLAGNLAQDAMIALLLELRRGSLRDPARLGISSEAARARKPRAQRRLMQLFGTAAPSRSPKELPPTKR